MVEVILWDNHEDLCQLKFLKEQKRKINFICPSPDMADDVFILHKHFDVFRVNATTISHFLQQELRKASQYLKDNSRRFIHKSELLMHFGILWKKLEPKSPDYLFPKVYKLFSELRSYTLDREIFAEALELTSEDDLKCFGLLGLFREKLVY